MLTIYTRQECSKCKILKQKLKHDNTPFIEVDVDESPMGLRFLKSRGIRTLPAVFDEKGNCVVLS